MVIRGAGEISTIKLNGLYSLCNRSNSQRCLLFASNSWHYEWTLKSVAKQYTAGILCSCCLFRKSQTKCRYCVYNIKCARPRAYTYICVFVCVSKCNWVFLDVWIQQKWFVASHKSRTLLFCSQTKLQLNLIRASLFQYFVCARIKHFVINLSYFSPQR